MLSAAITTSLLFVGMRWFQNPRDGRPNQTAPNTEAARRMGTGKPDASSAIAIQAQDLPTPEAPTSADRVSDAHLNLGEQG